MKKDLTFCIKFVEYNACLLSTPGLGVLELYCSLFPTPVAQISPMPLSLVKTVTCPTRFSNKKNLDFWSCVIQVVAKYIGKEIEAMLRVWLAIHFFYTSRDPPKIFIPLPKIESTNGCARSDLSARLFLASDSNAGSSL